MKFPTAARAMFVLPVAALGLGCSNTTTKPVVDPNPTVTPAPKATVDFAVERVTTVVPFPRGLQLVDGSLYVLSRGRVREYGGADGSIDDKAGYLFKVDPNVAESIHLEDVSDAVRNNGQVVAEPSSPPFRLFDRSAKPATKDRETDRPYCGLSYHPGTKSFYICAFSGIDKAEVKGQSTFSKNLTDAILRFDTRTNKWYEIERHDIEKGGLYPHHDPASAKAPHGWLNGPDNCLAVGSSLYAVAKDNSRLVRYDLFALERDPEAGPPASHFVLGDKLTLKDGSTLDISGHSMLAHRDRWLYVGTRTSSHIFRIPLDHNLLPVQPIVGELVARFDAYDAEKKSSANLTDMCFGPEGDLYVVSAKPSRVYRFHPDPQNVFDGRSGASPAYVDFAALTKNPKMKSENVLVDPSGRVYVTSGDAYDYQGGAGGVVYRATPIAAAN